MKKMVVMALCVLMAAFLFVNGCAMENVRRGQRGEAVKEVQERLISLGYLEGPADGAFGPKTEAAVLAFQKDRGLDATGIVGEATYGALTEEAAVPASGGAVDLEAEFPSWDSDSQSLRALVDFVADSTDEGSPNYLDPADRIATFDGAL